LPQQGGFPETMIADRTGFLYGPNTAAALAERVIDLWGNHCPTEVERLHAQTWVAERFSWERAGARLLSVLDAAPSGSRLRSLPRRRVIPGQSAMKRLLRRDWSPKRMAAKSNEFYDLSELRRSQGNIGLFFKYSLYAAAIWPLNLRVYVHMAVLAVPRPLRRKMKGLLGSHPKE